MRSGPSDGIKSFLLILKNFHALHGIKVKVFHSSLNFSTASKCDYMSIFFYGTEGDSAGGNNTQTSF